MREVTVKLTKRQAAWLYIVAKNKSVEHPDGRIRQHASRACKRLAKGVAAFDLEHEDYGTHIGPGYDVT